MFTGTLLGFHQFQTKRWPQTFYSHQKYVQFDNPRQLQNINNF